MRHSRIAFIGGGNMAGSLAGGLLADGLEASRISIGEPDARRRAELESRFGVAVTADNMQAAAGADVVVLAVKPQVTERAVADIAPARAGTLYLSVAAGLPVAALERWLGGEAAVVRAMPNTPALLGCGASAMFANTRVTDTQRELAESIMRAAGAVVWVEDESLMDAVTALSGSGPAYFFLLMEAMTRAGIEMGLEPDAARLLTQETALGAARMALESEEDVGALRERVTSPGGTTEAALGVLMEAEVPAKLEAAILAARDRGRSLAKELAGD